MPIKILIKINFTIILLFFIASCRSGSVKFGEDIQVPSHYKISTPIQILNSGENYRGRFSKDGAKILFISHERSKHEHPQVYEYSLIDKKERRITFQDGAIFDVAFSQDPNEILYSSTTDEIKENPEFILSFLNKENPSASQKNIFTNFYNEILPQTELYSSTRDGRNIQRLTESAGFDGQISTNTSTSAIAFISTRSNKRQIYILNSKISPPTKLPIGTDESDFASFSKDGKNLVWTRGKSEIWLSTSSGAKAKKIIADGFTNIEPTWGPTPDEIIFTSNRDGQNNFELYTVKIDGSCLRRLTFNSAQDRLADISPDGKQLLFSSNRTGKFQVYLTEYAPPPCPIRSESL